MTKKEFVRRKKFLITKVISKKRSAVTKSWLTSSIDLFLGILPFKVYFFGIFRPSFTMFVQDFALYI